MATAANKYYGLLENNLQATNTYAKARADYIAIVAADAKAKADDAAKVAADAKAKADANPADTQAAADAKAKADSAAEAAAHAKTMVASAAEAANEAKSIADQAVSTLNTLKTDAEAKAKAAADAKAKADAIKAKADAGTDADAKAKADANAKAAADAKAKADAVVQTVADVLVKANADAKAAAETASNTTTSNSAANGQDKGKVVSPLKQGDGASITAMGDANIDYLESFKECMRKATIWAQGLGNYAHQAPRAFSNGYNSTTWGITGGMDLPIYEDSITMGLGTGYGQSFIRSKDNCGRTDMDNIPANIYFGYNDANRPYYVNTVFSFNYSIYNASRLVTDGVNLYTASSRYNGQQYACYVESGYSFYNKKLSLTPFVGCQYMHSYTANYTETGAGALNLIVNSQESDMAQTAIGARLCSSYENKLGTLTPELHAKWLYDWIGDNQASTSAFAGGGAPFTTQGFTPAVSSYATGVKIGFKGKNNVAINLNYDLLLKEDYYEHTGTLDVRYTF